MPEEHIALRDFIVAILDEREKAMLVAASSLERRLEALNNLRSEVMKDRDMFLKKDVYDQMHAELVRRVDKVENVTSRIVGIGATLVVVAGIVGAVIGAVIAHLLK